VQIVGFIICVSRTIARYRNENYETVFAKYLPDGEGLELEVNRNIWSAQQCAVLHYRLTGASAMHIRYCSPLKAQLI